jgi:sugar phosphate permease
MAQGEPSGSQAPQSKLPRAVWALGFTSMFMDISSESIHALLPIYLTSVLGLSAATLGMVEGVAEATTLAVKIFSGAISDWLGRRKLPALLGYGLAALLKPVFPIAASAGLIVGAHILDRFAKGIRGAPRDALITDVTPHDQRGAAFGLRQSLDTIGGIVGPLLAVGLMLASHDNYRLVFWIACIPAILSVATLAIFVPADGATPRSSAFPLSRAAMRQMPGAFWIVVALGAGMAAARVSEAFLVLRAIGFGLDPAYAPFVLIGMSVVYGLVAYPAGALSDRASARMLVFAAVVALASAEAVLAMAQSAPVVFAGVALWGLHMALSQGLLAKLVADASPPTLRGTAFGLFNIASAIAIVIGNSLFGLVWSASGPGPAYAIAAAAALAVAILSLLVLPQRNGQR